MTVTQRIIGQGKDLALLPGFGFSSDCFLPLVEILSEKYCCHLIDLPGFRNNNYQSYTLDEILTELSHILPKEVILLGWSLGGMIGLAYATAYPSRVKKLMTLASNLHFCQVDNPKNYWPGMDKKTFNSFSNLCQSDKMKALKHFAMLQFANDEVVNKQQFKAMCERLVSSDIEQQALINALRLLSNIDLRERFNHLKVPAISVLAEKDQLVPVVLEEYLNKFSLSSHQTVVVKGAGHMLPINNYKYIKQILDTYIC